MISPKSQQNPAGLGIAFAVQQAGPLGAELFVNGLGDCLDLATITATANHKVIREGRNLANIQEQNV